jgi:hypothetical protein
LIDYSSKKGRVVSPKTTGSFEDLLQEQDTDRRRYVDNGASLVGQFSGFGVDAVGGDGVGVGSGGEKPVGSGNEVDVTGESSADGLDLDDFEVSGAGVGLVNADSVVATIGGVDKLATRMDEDFGGGVEGFGGFGFLGDGGGDGEFLGCSVGSIPCEGGDGEAKFVEEVNELSIYGKTHVARATAGDGVGCAVGSDGGFIEVDFVDHDLVETEVGDEGVITIRGKAAPVWVRRSLAFGDYIGSAFVFMDDGFTEFAIVVEGEDCCGTPAVLGRQQELAGGMDRYVGTSSVGVGLLGELCEGAIFANFVAYCSGKVFGSSGGVEFVTIRMESQESRRPNLCSEFNCGKPSVVRIEGGMINAFSTSATSAEVDMEWFGGEGGRKEKEGDG